MSSQSIFRRVAPESLLGFTLTVCFLGIIAVLPRFSTVIAAGQAGDSLDQWLAGTDKFIPDNDMNLSFKDAAERADIIAYLKQLSNP